MIDEAIGYVENVIAGLIDFMNRVFNSLPGAVELIMGIFIISTVVRLLLMPLVGGIMAVGISDVADQWKHNGKRGKYAERK